MTQPRFERKRDKPRALVVSQLTHRQLVGWLGFSLPWLVCVIDMLLPTDGLHDLGVLDSVSAYYYSSAGTPFVGINFALGLLLITFPGYEGVEKDRWVGIVGGAGALALALLPTSPPDGWLPPSWWCKSFGGLHLFGAGLLFLSFFLFAGWLFRLSNIEPPSARPPDKKRRDAFYLVCAVVIAACMGLIGVMKLWWKPSFPIFWPEALAIEAFGASWLIKGEAHRSRPARAVFKAIGIDMPPDSEALGQA